MLTVKNRHGKKINFFHFHSLSIVALAILLLWVLLYLPADPNSHSGAFYGNAIADWSGTVVIIIATKYFLERGSEESRPVRKHFQGPVFDFIYCHSLSIFLVVTGAAWFILYARMDANSKWGQVVGNVCSEWVQTLGLVLLTKKLVERGSRESHQK